MNSTIDIEHNPGNTAAMTRRSLLRGAGLVAGAAVLAVAAGACGAAGEPTRVRTSAPTVLPPSPQAGGTTVPDTTQTGTPTPDGGQTSPPAGGAAQVRVEITDDGFNGKPRGFTVEVRQGQAVELTFVFAQKGAVEDNHIILLSGYGIETKEINYNNKQDTLKFVADKAGTFDFRCDLDCEIHGDLRGQLIVK